jgi:hypothetical protein
MQLEIKGQKMDINREHQSLKCSVGTLAVWKDRGKDGRIQGESSIQDKSHRPRDCIHKHELKLEILSNPIKLVRIPGTDTLKQTSKTVVVSGLLCPSPISPTNAG